MRTPRVGLVVLALLAVSFAAAPAHAAHHLWRLERAFSNASGSVQYVELFTTDTGENAVGNEPVTDNGSFAFPPGFTLSGDTTNTWLLFATQNFQSLTGVQPDGPIPAGFLTTGGGTVTYASPVVDSWPYGALPTDGKTMLVRDPNTNQVTTASAVAKNFAGMSTPVNLTAAAAPALPRWAVVLGTGLTLLAGSGLLRRRRADASA